MVEVYLYDEDKGGQTDEIAGSELAERGLAGWENRAELRYGRLTACSVAPLLRCSLPLVACALLFFLLLNPFALIRDSFAVRLILRSDEKALKALLGLVHMEDLRAHLTLKDKDLELIALNKIMVCSTVWLSAWCRCC